MYHLGPQRPDRPCCGGLLEVNVVNERRVSFDDVLAQIGIGKLEDQRGQLMGDHGVFHFQSFGCVHRIPLFAVVLGRHGLMFCSFVDNRL